MRIELYLLAMISLFLEASSLKIQGYMAELDMKQEKSNRNSP